MSDTIIIPSWMQLILKTILGAFLGTVAGFGTGVGTVYLFAVSVPSRGICSEAMALGMVAAAIVVIFTGVGFVAGTETALILHAHSVRKNKFRPPFLRH